MAPGTFERLGLGYDVVKALNPKIIYCQIQGFGEGSPYEKNLAFDMIAQACGGVMSVTGEADRPPAKPGVSLGDTGTGMLMAITLLGALFKARQTGRGHRLPLAMHDTMELQNDPSLEQRGIMQVMQHPTHGAFKMPAWPVRVDGAPPRLESSPMLGQHSADVLETWLGMNPTAVKSLKDEGVI